jgi:hypothetical protein
MSVMRVRLTLEAKRWLNAPLNPVLKPFLDRVAVMLAASMRDEAAERAQMVQP